MPPRRDLEREARLAAALRENLRRRKAQSRARAAEAEGTSDGRQPPEGANPPAETDPTPPKDD